MTGQYSEEQLQTIFCGTPGADTSASCYRLRTGGLPGLLSIAPSYTNALAYFAGALGNDNNGLGGAGSSHVGVGGLANAFVDDRPFYTDNLAITWSLVGANTHTYVASSTIPLNRKQLQTAAVAGPHVLLDVSGPSCAISDATPWVYGVVLFANECVSGSSPGQVYVSAPYRTYLGCYGGQGIIDIYAPGGNVQQDICVFPSGNNVNSIVQMGYAPDPVGWRYSGVVSYLSNGKNKMGAGFANWHPFIDSSWGLANEQFGSLFGTQVTAIKMPPASTPLDSVNRADFVPMTIKIPALSGSDGAVVEYGYAENGTDGLTKFYCTSRQENCEANQATVNDTTPFYFASETYSPLSCSSGCTVTIPALPAHEVYFRVKRTLSGTVVAAGTVTIAAAP